MRPQKSNEKASNPTLSPDDWNFSVIPPDELCIAEIYEYSREFKTILVAFDEWLSKEGRILVNSVLRDDGEYQDCYEYLKKSNRELLQSGKFPILCPGDGCFDITPETLLKDVEGDLDFLPLSALAPILGHWPKPYKAIRRSQSFREFFAQLKKPKPFLESIRWARQSDLHNMRPNLKLMQVVVDTRADRKELQERFGKMFESILKAPEENQEGKCGRKKRPGRKRNAIPPQSKLKQLAAYRICNRGLGKDKTFSTYA